MDGHAASGWKCSLRILKGECGWGQTAESGKSKKSRFLHFASLSLRLRSE
jgi:hypothetical protein